MDWAHPQEGHESCDKRVLTLMEEYEPLPFYLRRGAKQSGYMDLV